MSMNITIEEEKEDFETAAIEKTEKADADALRSRLSEIGWGGWTRNEEMKFMIIPNYFFDEMVPYLKNNTLRIFLYILRRLKGFQKHAEYLSIPQIGEGVKISRPTVIESLKWLEYAGLITISKSKGRTSKVSLLWANDANAEVLPPLAIQKKTEDHAAVEGEEQRQQRRQEKKEKPPTKKKASRSLSAPSMPKPSEQELADIKEIWEKWCSYRITASRKGTEFFYGKFIHKALTAWSKEEIIESISNYASVVNDDNCWYHRRMPLDKFLGNGSQSSPIEVFHPAVFDKTAYIIAFRRKANNNKIVEDKEGNKYDLEYICKKYGCTTVTAKHWAQIETERRLANGEPPGLMDCNRGNNNGCDWEVAAGAE